ncbi:argininosuccinate lyase [Nannocystis exedens]|uniref:Argininosuccinate lyase n=1 Tax=Nannocystis exedens TaxID=54 RepID=A0A1I2A0G0_9BACT|nr:argininosuccinate lyase [Nannocystis exedens]PCC75250.1 argininosuccinate lyase [Nannocystis exedens]SFE36413.1 argininosuccinate lyase [Nannocystis exedens]
MSTRPLWDKGQAALDAAAQEFCAGDDVVLDRRLILHDIRASIAHVHGLQRIDVLAAAEAEALVNGLGELAEAVRAGSFVLDERFEDGHSAIEWYLSERLGDVGRKVHTGRSRNDQVLVAMRLWLKDALADLRARCLDCADACLRRAETTRDVALPGYTHLQRAVPSSLAALLAGHAEAFLDDAETARATAGTLDSSPLGTAAGYGVNLPLDRDGVARELGFSRVQVSPIYAQNSRGKLELLAVQALHQALLDVRRLAWDLSLYSTAEFAFVRLPDAYTTGSSIMPNKRNPDVVELLRAVPSVTEGAMSELSSLLSLPSGYHRDLQATKAPVLRAFTRGLAGLALVPALVHTLELDVARMAAAIDPELYATDRAVELARAGVPFRDAYRQAAAEMHDLKDRSPAESLAARVSLGGPGNLGLDRLRARLDALR